MANPKLDLVTKKMKGLTVGETSEDLDYSGLKMDNAKNAFAASIHLMMCHVSDFHKLMLRILSEKYKIPVEDMLNTIIEHPDYENMYVSPTFQSLGLFSQEDVDAVIEPPAKRRPTEEKEPEEKPASSLPVKRKLTLKKK